MINSVKTMLVQWMRLIRIKNLIAIYIERYLLQSKKKKKKQLKKNTNYEQIVEQQLHPQL